MRSGPRAVAACAARQSMIKFVAFHVFMGGCSQGQPGKRTWNGIFALAATSSNHIGIFFCFCIIAAYLQTFFMKPAILLVAFGIGSTQGQIALKDFDLLVRQRYPGLSVRWAFSSQIVRTRMAQARKKSDSVFKAVRRLAFERFTHIAVQPLQTIPGMEHSAVLADVAEAAAMSGLACRVGAPLLATERDIHETAQALIHHLPAGRAPHEDVVFMGHGTKHEAVSRYWDLAKIVRLRDSHVHVGAMTGVFTLDSILPLLTSCRVWLLPLLSVIGRHALHDMAGQGASSWRKRIEACGHQCLPVLHGLAEYSLLAEIWLRHLDSCVQALAEDSAT